MRIIAALVALGCFCRPAEDNSPPEGFRALFNGRDLTGWKVPPHNNGAWKVVHGTIDCDPVCRDQGDARHLWTEAEYANFTLQLDWRFKPEKVRKFKVPLIDPDGSERMVGGKVQEAEVDEVDSGVFLRGSEREQVNIWNWPIGSGELWSYRTDKKYSKEIHAAATPRKRMDKPVGEWNHMEITLKGDRLRVSLNGEDVIVDAPLPDARPRGPIGFQHHNFFDGNGTSHWEPTYIQIKNIYLKELP